MTQAQVAWQDARDDGQFISSFHPHDYMQALHILDPDEALFTDGEF